MSEKYRMDFRKLAEILGTVNGHEDVELVHLTPDGVMIIGHITDKETEKVTTQEIGRLITGQRQGRYGPIPNEEFYLQTHEHETRTVSPNLVNLLREYVV